VSESLALELRDISKSFGAFRALDNARIAVRRGTVHGLLGENGAGKTTLMRVAFGMLAPEGGSIMVEGARRRFGSPMDAIAAGLAMVQQHPANVPAMTVWENVFLGGRGTLDPAAARKRVGHLARELGFDIDPNARASDLPVASQQKLDIMKALSRSARILILDEPTAILTPAEARELYLWLRAFANDGGAVVVITHKLQEAMQYADDLTVLRGGRTVLVESSATVDVPRLTHAMIGDVALTTVQDEGPGNAGEIVISVDGLSLTDALGISAIRDATFTVRAGEIVGIAGVNGSGHHELLLALAGRMVPHAGTVRAPAVVGFVPEDRHRNAMVADFSIEENIALRGAGQRRGRMPWRAIATRTDDLLQRFDIRARGRGDRMATLSGGNQQKTVTARELDENPAALVVENPTRGLDIRAAAFVRDQLRAARDNGVAVVVYSSDLDELMELSDRALVVHAGTVSEAPLDPARIGAAMLGASS
jgi:simple sugar transport system ATP-binding protein